MGTPEFALPSLQILVENNLEVVAVITATDKWLGRGEKQIIQTPIKKYAVSRGIPVLQPEKLKDPLFLEELRSFQADIQIVVAFRMLPEVVWNMPRLGTMNLHGSLLPRYRGAAPINWAIINGETETGVSTFMLKHEIDTGDLLMQESLSIGPDETAGELHDRMMYLGAKVLLKSVQLIASGHYQPIPQNNDLAIPAPKLFHETCEIHYEKTGLEIHNFIRGLSPYPAAWTTLEGKILKVFRSAWEKAEPIAPPGQYFSDNKSYVKVSTTDGYIKFTEVQMEGRKKMDIAAFLNGFKFPTPGSNE